MSSDSEGDLSSEVGFSTDLGTDLGSTVPTREDDLTVGDTSRDEIASSAAVVQTHDQSAEEDVAVALPPTESDGAGEYHEIALTGSAALDLLDQVSDSGTS